MLADNNRGEERVVVNCGGYFVPSQSPWLEAVVGSIRFGTEGVSKKKTREWEASVENMDVPFLDGGKSLIPLTVAAVHPRQSKLTPNEGAAGARSA